MAYWLTAYLLLLIALFIALLGRPGNESFPGNGPIDLREERRRIEAIREECRRELAKAAILEHFGLLTPSSTVASIPRSSPTNPTSSPALTSAKDCERSHLDLTSSQIVCTLDEQLRWLD